MPEFVPRALLDNLDDLPEEVTIKPRELYARGEGDLADRYVFTLEEVDGFGIANPGELGGSLDAERKARAKERRLKEQAERDLKKQRERVAELEGQLSENNPDAAALEKTLRGKLEQEFERKLNAAVSAKTEEIEGLTGQRDAFEQQIRDLMLASVTGRGETDKWKFKPRHIDPHIRGRVQIERDEESGEFIQRFLDAKGQPGFKADGRTPWDLDDLLGDFAKDPDLGELLARKDGTPPRRTGGPNDPGTPPRSNGRERVLSADELNDFASFNRIADQVVKDGGSLSAPPSS